MEFKSQGKRKGRGTPDTLYFNAFSEDLFVWHNDLDADTDRHLTINENSSFLNGITELALDQAIAGYLSRYADFDCGRPAMTSCVETFPNRSKSRSSRAWSGGESANRSLICRAAAQ
ncbi:MAG: hypothetical protein F4Z93_03385 [Rhodospirillales bacterium]|nr:hypothetical protein [Rhodospirillales bacterium]